MIQVRITRNGNVTTHPVHTTDTQKADVLESYRVVAGMIRGVKIEDIRNDKGELIGFTSTTVRGGVSRFEVLEVEAEAETP